MNQLSKTIIILLTVSLIPILSACSTALNQTVQEKSKEYTYAHKCTQQGQPVTRFITAKVPLTANELASLRQTLDENAQLDHQSCVYTESSYHN